MKYLIIFTLTSLITTMNYALDTEKYHFVYAYKTPNSNQYIVEVARTELFSGIASKRFHPSITVHWLLINNNSAFPLKLKWLDETRELSSDKNIGEIQRRAFAGYQLYSEINSGRAAFSYNSNGRELQLARIPANKEFELIDTSTLTAIAKYMDDFYFGTREVVSKMRCHISAKNTHKALDINIQYYAKPYDGGFIPNTNSPVIFSIQDESNKHHKASAHGEVSIKHSSLHGITNTLYKLNIEQLLNPFYHTEKAQIASRKDEIILKNIFGEKFKTLTISSDQQHNISAKTIFDNTAVDETSCKRVSTTSKRSLYESLEIN